MIILICIKFAIPFFLGVGAKYLIDKQLKARDTKVLSEAESKTRKQLLAESNTNELVEELSKRSFVE